MSRIYLDSMTFACWIEDNPVFRERVTALPDRILDRGDTVCTSVFTPGELLAGPYKKGATDVAAAIIETVRPPQVELIPFESGTAHLFANLRASTSVSATDAIHPASAGCARGNRFITSDRALRRVAVRGIGFIAGLDVNLF